MTAVQIDVYLKDCLRWNDVDLFYAFCEAKGIEDPEQQLNEERYSRMEKEFTKRVNRRVLNKLVNNITSKVNELMVDAMTEVIDDV